MKEFRYVCDGCGLVTDYRGVHVNQNPWVSGWTFMSQQAPGVDQPSKFYCPTCWPKMTAAVREAPIHR